MGVKFRCIQICRRNVKGQKSKKIFIFESIDIELNIQYCIQNSSSRVNRSGRVDMLVSPYLTLKKDCSLRIFFKFSQGVEIQYRSSMCLLLSCSISLKKQLRVLFQFFGFILPVYPLQIEPGVRNLTCSISGIAKSIICVFRILSCIAVPCTLKKKNSFLGDFYNF